MNLQDFLGYNLLSEAPFDVWKRKNSNEDKEKIEKAQEYFTDLTGRYKASLHPSLTDLTRLSFDELERIHQAIQKGKERNLELSAIKDLTKKAKEEPDLNIDQTIGENSPISEENYGKIADKDGWAVYLPHTTEASCEIGKTAGRRDTTWCTTRPDASNMFLQYVARPEDDTVLFYVVKKGVNAEKDSFAKMSVGFVDGKPKFNMGNSQITVNAKNANLTEKKFREVLGNDLADYFLSAMHQKAKEIKGKHPAKQEFERLVQDPKAFQAKLESFAKNTNGQKLKKDFIETALKYPNVSTEIFILLAKDPNVKLREEIAENPNTSPEALNLLAKDPNDGIRITVAGNPNTPPEALNLLAEDPDYDIRGQVARNRNITPEVVSTLLANDPEVGIRINVAANRKTPVEILNLLANDPDRDVRWAAKETIKLLNKQALTEALILDKVLKKLLKT